MTMSNSTIDDVSASSPVVKSAGRVFEVLELFRRTHRQLSATEIGAALGYPKSSTNALLKSLVALGYLVFDPRTLRYFPSLSVAQLGEWIPSVVFASGEVMSVLSDIHAATQETVTLSVQTDLQCRFLRVLQGTFPISLRMTEGYQIPLLTTAVGSAVLSHLPDDEIGQLVARANARVRRKNERHDAARIQKTVREVRQRGYAVAYDAVFPDTGAIAVPFSSDIDGFPMAIGVGGLCDRIRRSEAAIYRAVRASVTRYLGRRPAASARRANSLGARLSRAAHSSNR
jgi:IclR family KDG regulon transcriptional repressor